MNRVFVVLEIVVMMMRRRRRNVRNLNAEDNSHSTVLY
jgi:hypothetical protein